MAFQILGVANLRGYSLLAGEPDDVGPPPSTLAAQLVENISTSARSSRPDETQELKRLFSVIEQVKNQPDILKTPDQQVEHNHMLIYVYTRVVLDGLQWHSLFADREALCTEALKAINFLKVTIKETPDVLAYTTDGKAFLFRGREPLWLWVLPKVLKMLGNDHCKPLTLAIEGLCAFMLKASSRPGEQSSLTNDLLLYFRTITQGVLNHLVKCPLSSRDTTINLDLPAKQDIERFVALPYNATSQYCSYQVPKKSQAIRHVMSMLTVMSSIISHSKSLDISPQVYPCIPWLLDSLLLLQGIQARSSGLAAISMLSTIRCILGLLPMCQVFSGPETPLVVKTHNILVLLCGKALEHPEEFLSDDDNGVASRNSFCEAMVPILMFAMRNKSVSRLIRSQLLGPLEGLIADNKALLDDGTGFPNCLHMLKDATQSPVFDAYRLPGAGLNNAVNETTARMQLYMESSHGVWPMTEDVAEPPSKRRRVDAEPLSLGVMLQHLSSLVVGSSSDASALSSPAFLDGFGKLDDQQRCTSINLLSAIVCASDDSLRGSIPDPRDQATLECVFCKGGGTGTRPACLDVAAKARATAAFTSLLQVPGFLESRKPRVMAMMCLRRLVYHSVDPEFLDLESSAAGQWCLQSLQSSVRELRVAAGRSIPAFLGDGIGNGAYGEIAKRNRANVIGILKSISDKNSANILETCIMAWRQVGSVVSDEELNLVLAKLVEFLGHSNQIIPAFAVNEILSLALSRRQTVRQLFNPFWESLAFSIVKDIVTRPQITRTIAELLQLSVSELVLLLQRHALPWLVLTKRKEVIQKIAEFRGETEAWRPCVDSANFGSILALLLMQDVPQARKESFTMTLLRNVSPHFENSSLVDILRGETLQTVLELLKAAAGADEDKKTRISKALQTMALLLADNKEARKKKNIVGSFLQQHALGITAWLAEVVNDNAITHPPAQEQRRCIRAMEEMIVLCGPYIRIARPQIAAFLLTALTYDELRPASFSCWAVLINSLEEDGVQLLLDPTFIIIIKYWDAFGARERSTCQEIMELLLQNHSKLLESRVDELPTLGHIREMAPIEKRLKTMRRQMDNRRAFGLFAKRISHENSGVVLQALTELAAYLRTNQDFLQTSALSEQPDPVVAVLSRALLDCSAKYNGTRTDIARLCVECVGHVGCLDSNRLETVREQRSFVVLHNFDDGPETGEFVLFLLEEVLVKAFLSAADPNFQGFLSYAMQELLEKCNYTAAVAWHAGEASGSDVEMQAHKAEAIYEKWLELPESVREVLTPFMTSRYRIQPIPPPVLEYPVFRPNRSYATWLRPFVVDLLHRGQSSNAQLIFEPLSRVIKVKDLAVAEFLLPYLFLHIIVADDDRDNYRNKVFNELLGIVLYQPPEDASYAERENAKMYCEAVFRILDYATRWINRKRVQPGLTKRGEAQIRRLTKVLEGFPPEAISKRSVECKQYARALLHLEPYVQKQRAAAAKANDGGAQAAETQRLLSELQYIYSQIDEPDGLEGLSSELKLIDLNQQILSHRKAGRWTAAQTWYEIELAKDPSNTDVQLELLTCLKESGQHDVLLNHIKGMDTTPATINKILPFAVEASWATGRWETLKEYLDQYTAGDITEVFELGVARSLLFLKQEQPSQFTQSIQLLQQKIASSMSQASTSSLHACHDAMLKAHVLTDLQIIADQSKTKGSGGGNQHETLARLDRRLEIIGAYVNDKQYLLGIRRAAMELMRPQFGDKDISSLWLYSARLARKSGSMQQSFNAVIHAHQLGDGSATIDNARLLWKENHHRKAIQVLQSAITNQDFLGNNQGTVVPTASKSVDSGRNMLTARAHLMLAKWLDSAGQTHASALRVQYQQAAKTHPQWEKGHYYLGRHYKKVLESEKNLKPDDQSDEYLSGETAKLVIENYLRSLNYGTKYLYQTLPRVLTLWLELGAQVGQAPEGKASLSKELYQRRKLLLQELHKTLMKQIQRMPAYIFYTALPQLVARIAHPNLDVFKVLEAIIIKVVEAHPQQALWSLFGIMTTRQASERKARGLQLLQGLRSVSKKTENGGSDLQKLLKMGEKLAEQLLLACNNGDFQSNRTTVASITRDLHFNHKVTPCPLVVPVEASLTATLPTLTDNVRKHRAFSGDVVTIQGFEDEVLVLGSLAKPRKLSARGSDGKLYGLLIKPKDDLRTDQRLMEFNGLINRSLKRDAESSRRQLYIRTYAVTPLNEECGIIEWVDGLKTLRDILLLLYKTRGVTPNYGQIAQLMRDAVTSDANISLFTETVLGQFPPVLPLWFVAQFPNPSAWFPARLRYTRSCAVMSMVGTILGLGDRHGENVLLEEGNGGVFHVDFNCLFDKGLTFQQPERVPFRLTHNMVSAMGIHGYEGPFRQCSELTLTILRQQEETLMTILEAFIYDPTLDLQKDKKRKHEVVKLNPQSVVESIKRKVRGLLPDESIPLGVEGQVDELIRQAVNPRNLAAMYIGWCPFL